MGPRVWADAVDVAMLVTRAPKPLWNPHLAVRRLVPRNEDRVLHFRMGPHALKTASLQLPIEAVAR